MTPGAWSSGRLTVGLFIVWSRLSWARLLKRMFEIDLEHHPYCGGSLKIIAAIEHPLVITKIADPSRLARPSTAPSNGQGLRSIRTALIPHRSPLPSGLVPEPTLPLGPCSPEGPKEKRSET